MAKHEMIGLGLIFLMVIGAIGLVAFGADILNPYGDTVAQTLESTYDYNHFETIDIMTDSNDLVIEWLDLSLDDWGKDYIFDPNDMLDLMITDFDGNEAVLEMKPDGNLYLSGGSLEFVVTVMYEHFVLNGQKFTGELILE